MNALHYDNITLVPRYSQAKSRSSISLKTEIGNQLFNLPVMPANMSCVIDERVARRLQESSLFYVMHRFSDTFKFVETANNENWKTISISVGVNQVDKDLLTLISESGHRVDYITIDIAHGHSILMKEMIAFVRDLFTNTVCIIAGNVGTVDGFADVGSWGADIVKVGIGPGAACTTKLKTGFFTPMFSTVRDISGYRDSYAPELKIIADGGIVYNGDIAKALVAGADYIMAGGMFAACTDSPARKEYDGSVSYFGSASEHNKDIKKHIEGKLVNLTTNSMTYLEKMNEIEQDLQSATSYAGGKLNRSVDYIIVH